ncbi:type II secretion system F family protein [candidate division KSB1 bacterium]
MDTLFKKRQRNTVTINDLIEFTDQMHVLYKAGFTISSSLTFLNRQLESKPLEEASFGIALMLERGNSFSNGLAEYPKVFPEYYIKVVKSAEIGGVMQETLLRLSGYLKAQKKLEQDIKKTFQYPNFVLKAVIAASLFLAFFQGMIETTSANFALTALALLVYFIIKNALKRYISQGDGKHIWDSARLNMIIFKKAYRDSVNTKFAEHFKSIFKTGIHIEEVFRLIGDSMENRIYGSEVRAIGERINRGEKVSEVAASCHYFPHDLKEHLRLGDITGEYDRNLDLFIGKKNREIRDFTQKAKLYLYIAYLSLLCMLILIMWGSFNLF